MKKILCLMLTLVLALCLAACGCDHEWKDADCENPKTCGLCGETEGEALGHDWKDADCENPKTCAVCDKTEGEALGHSWEDADCENPKICSVCGATEGEALGHEWKDATTEEPMTCAVCGATEGERITTDERFHTADCEAVFGVWQGILTLDGDMMGIDGLGDITLDMLWEITFRNDGTMNSRLALADEEAYMEAIRVYTVNLFYEQFAAAGLDAEAADAAMKETYGMTIAEYVTAAMEGMDVSDYYEDQDMAYVYYVSGETIYSAESWSDTMEEIPFRLDGDKLYLSGASVEDLGLGITEMVLNRVS